MAQIPFSFVGSKRHFTEGREALDRLSASLYPQVMDTPHQVQLQHRQKVIAFWHAHGLEPTRDAFGVSRRTLFRWQHDTTPKSRAHRRGYQKRIIPLAVAEEINRVRAKHPRLGKEKLTPLLARFCVERSLPVYAEATVGRVLTQLKIEGRLKAPVKLRMNGKTGELVEKKPLIPQKKERRNGYLPKNPGDLLQLDGVLKLVYAKRRYIFTAVDLVARIGWAKAYPSNTSRHGKNFLTHILTTTPFPIAHIQTDNGAEFLKEFREAAKEADLVQFFNWVKQPKYQGWVERFNRTIQEEFIDQNLALLADDLEEFNRRLTEWILWYNTERIHRGLNQKTAQGVQKYTPLQYLALTVECQRG